ncbi:glycosyltransferase family 4 protein [Edaphobacter sp. 12200R-103]|uniref:rhamnosyltransferase WsaF family glycosyltransferase n=1 Tax=Edaphobacter sp. 12200R-103 TaxID=2703788 RepID=UPI00138B9E12|nr:glycosyltransferase family 4 protein [Edaphobacter sp. 12200R-103]QHS50703.1 glycosyltransferase family 4 protein [Edaphobacter sp. 12200R-103]
MSRALRQLQYRGRQLRALLLENNAEAILDRVRRKLAESLLPKDFPLPVGRKDVLAADLAHPPHYPFLHLAPGQRPIINWVMVPAGPGSGGHTTIFRIIRYLEAHGYTNRIYFYNLYRADHQHYASIVRSFYGFHGIVDSIDREMEDAHAVVATAWSTAYPVFNARCSGKRFYFVQDYEPLFFPTGAISLLAENTYRMGFHAITAGRWLAHKLSTEFQMPADSFDFGCDTSIYQRTNTSRRSGIVFYARREATRRGFELGIMALELFAARHPEIEIHFYGERVGKLPFRFIDHGHITPQHLNIIYNQCSAGLSLSLTNVSLVPHEMLAAGCIPVVNDAEQNRIVLDNSCVHYAAPHPQALADALASIVINPHFDALSQRAAASVHGTSWDDAGNAVDQAFRRALTTPSESSLKPAVARS